MVFIRFSWFPCSCMVFILTALALVWWYNESATDHNFKARFLVLASHSISEQNKKQKSSMIECPRILCRIGRHFRPYPTQLFGWKLQAYSRDDLPPLPPVTHSITHPLTHSLTRARTHSLTLSLTPSLTPPHSIHTFTHSVTLSHALTHALNHSLNRSLIHSLSHTRSLTHLLTNSLAHSLARSLARSVGYDFLDSPFSGIDPRNSFPVLLMDKISDRVKAKLVS